MSKRQRRASPTHTNRQDDAGLKALALVEWSKIASRVKAHAFEKDRLAKELFGLYREHWGTETEYIIDDFINELPFWDEEDTIQVFFMTCVERKNGHIALKSALTILALTEEKDGVNGVQLLEMMLYEEKDYVVLPIDCPECLADRAWALFKIERQDLPEEELEAIRPAFMAAFSDPDADEKFDNLIANFGEE